MSVWAGIGKVIYLAWDLESCAYSISPCTSVQKPLNKKNKKKSSSFDSVNSLISSSVTALILLRVQCLTIIIIAGAQMSSESLAHEAEG